MTLIHRPEEWGPSDNRKLTCSCCKDLPCPDAPENLWEGNCGVIGAIAAESEYFRKLVDDTVADLREEKYAKREVVLQTLDGIQIQVIITRDETDFLTIEE